MKSALSGLTDWIMHYIKTYLYKNGEIRPDTWDNGFLEVTVLHLDGCETKERRENCRICLDKIR